MVWNLYIAFVRQDYAYFDVIRLQCGVKTRWCIAASLIFCLYVVDLVIYGSQLCLVMDITYVACL